MSVSQSVSESPESTSSDMVGTGTTLERTAPRILPSQSLLKISNPDVLNFHKPKGDKLTSLLTPQQPKDEKIVSILIPPQPTDDKIASILVPSRPNDDNVPSFLVPLQPKDDKLTSLLTPQQPKDEKIVSILIPPQPTDDKIASILVPSRPNEDDMPSFLIPLQPKDEKVTSILIPKQAKEDNIPSVLAPEQKTQKSDPVFKPPIPVSSEAGTSTKSVRVQKSLSSFNTKMPPTPGFPSLIKIAPKAILPKPKHQTIIPKNFALCGKHTIAYLGTGTLIRSETMRVLDQPQLLVPPTSQGTNNNSPALLISTVPKKLAIPTSAGGPFVPLGADPAFVSKPGQKLTSVLLPGNTVGKKGGSNKYINLKITNGKIIPPGQASIKFLREGAPIGSSLGKISAVQPLTNVSVKPSNRLMPKFTALSPVIDALDTLSPTFTKMNVDDAVEEEKAQDAPTTEPSTSSDLNLCLQEAVDSMFSTNIPTDPDAVKSRQDNEVTLVKVPLLPDTTVTVVQDETASEEVEDDVQIELVEPDVEVTAVSAKPLKEEISLRFSDILKSQLLGKTEEKENDEGGPSTDATVESAEPDTVEPFMPVEMTMVVDRDTEVVEAVVPVDPTPALPTPLCEMELEEPCADVDEEMEADVPESAYDTDSEQDFSTDDDEDVDEDEDMDEDEDVDEDEDMDEDEEVAETLEPLRYPEGERLIMPLDLDAILETRRRITEDLLTWRNGVGVLAYSKLRFKLNEFGLVEMIDPVTVGCKDLDDEDGDKDDPGAQELTKEDDKPCEKPKIEIEKPKIEIEKPKIEIEKPKLEIEKPNIEIEKPNIDIEKPKIAIEKPKIVVVKHKIGIEKPKIKIFERAHSILKPCLKSIGKKMKPSLLRKAGVRSKPAECKSDENAVPMPDLVKNGKRRKIKKKIKSPITKTLVGQEDVDKPSAEEGSKSKMDEIFHCEECGCYGLDVEFFNKRFCSHGCEVDWTLKMEIKRRKEEEKLQLKLKRREKRKLIAMQLKAESQNLREPTGDETKPVLEEGRALPETEPEVESVPEVKSEPRSPKSESPSERDPPATPPVDTTQKVNVTPKEETSNDGSQESVSSKSRLPWQTGKHGFSWTKYLEFNKAKPAPVKLFKDPFPYSKNNFKVGMKMEGIDPKHPNHFCVLTVVDVYGYRIKLHFDGYKPCYDFWVNADSMDIFAAGWCERNSYTLHPPPNYNQSNFNWSDYLKHSRGQLAPKNLFYNRTNDNVCPNGFRIGMKLEAVDRHNTALVCVATVAGLMDSRIMVHFDSWDDMYNYWADPSSSYIHPVGWCKEHGHKLTPPSDWPASSFTWDEYLHISKATAAPARAFKQRLSSGFRRGMKLECVDKRVPALVRVATVDDLREHQIRVKFDGWSDIYSYWVDEDSRDIHPMGWCQAVGHVLEPPYSADDHLADCPTKDCRGQGHVMGSKHMANHTVPGCPFDPQNLIKQEDYPDRLSSVPESSVDDLCDTEKRVCEPVKNPIGRPPKWRRLSLEDKVAVPAVTESDVAELVGERKRKKRTLDKPTRPYCKKKDVEALRREIYQAVVNPGYKPCGTEGPAAWAKHSHPLNVYINLAPTDRDVQSWSLEHVAKFVASIPDCRALVDKVEEMDIDGEALFMMTQNDFIKYMGCKVGPAVKIYNCVLLLRQKVEQN